MVFRHEILPYSEEMSQIRGRKINAALFSLRLLEVVLFTHILNNIQTKTAKGMVFFVAGRK